MAGDKVLPIPIELQNLTFVLADQIGKARFAVSDAVGELAREVPLELLWRRRLVDVLRLLSIRLAGGTVGLLTDPLAYGLVLALKQDSWSPS